MKIEKFIRVDEWLNIRLDPKDNESLFDFSEFFEGKKHTLSEAHELYQEWLNFRDNGVEKEIQVGTV